MSRVGDSKVPNNKNVKKMLVNAAFILSFGLLQEEIPNIFIFFT